MEFGLLYEVVVRNSPDEMNDKNQLPWHAMVKRPYDRKAANIVFRDLVEQVKIADEVGFHSVWHVEHHFLHGFSESSSNDVILGAYAAATENIRLGYGVKLLPFNYNHPVRAAEAVATLDQLSGGRVEFGTGRSFTREELEGFGIHPQETRGQWEESLEIIMEAWKNDRFTWDSPNFTIPERTIVPKPLQEPHPPLWLAGAGPESHELAGSKGVGLLSFSLLVPLEQTQGRIELYRDAIKKCTDPIGGFINNQVAPFTIVYCGESDEEAREVGAPACVDYVKTGLTMIYETMKWIDGIEGDTYDYMKQVGDVDLDILDFDLLNDQNMVICGDPDTCIEKVKKYQEIGVDILLGDFQAAGIPMDKVKASIRRWGKEVMPAFQ